MGLLALIILATIFYTLFDVFASKAGNKIDASYSSFLFNGVGASIPLIVFFYLKSKGAEIIPTTKEGILYSILAGVAIAIFSILLITIFQKGGLSYVVPLIYGGTIILASVIGYLFLREQVSGLQWLGIVVITVGIALVIISKIRS